MTEEYTLERVKAAGALAGEILAIADAYRDGDLSQDKACMNLLRVSDEYRKSVLEIDARYGRESRGVYKAVK